MRSDPDDVAAVRRLGVLTEALHAVVYFAPEPQARYAALGLRGYWRGYFASRTAAAAPPSAELATALLGGFAPQMVARAIPEVWRIASPADVLSARLTGATQALRRLLREADVEPAAAALGVTLDSLPLPARPLAAAHVALTRPQHALGLVWHTCTVLREHRGDGHLAAVDAAGLVWPEPHLLLAAVGHLDARQQEYRGWTDQQWEAARERLADRGLLAPAAARELVEQVEVATDRLAAAAYAHVDIDRLAALLSPLAAQAARALPFPNAMGLRDLSVR